MMRIFTLVALVSLVVVFASTYNPDSEFWKVPEKPHVCDKSHVGREIDNGSYGKTLVHGYYENGKFVPAKW
jgi:hypothetical protein